MCPDGYFKVVFVGKTMSRYTTNLSFRHNLTQEDILCWHMPDDLDTMMNYRDLVATSPEGQFRVLDPTSWVLYLN